MARRFRGESEQTIDAKGRVSVPPSMRRVVEAGDPDWSGSNRPKLFIVYGGAKQRHLECYTVQAMDEIDARIDLMKKGSVERKMLEELYNGLVVDVEIVEDGRIGLPQKLREKLGLTTKAYFIASGDHFNIWHPDTYQETQASKIDAWLDEQGDDFDPASLLPDLPVAG